MIILCVGLGKKKSPGFFFSPSQTAKPGTSESSLWWSAIFPQSSAGDDSVGFLDPALEIPEDLRKELGKNSNLNGVQCHTLQSILFL